jgi:hypothetical protein
VSIGTAYAPPDQTQGTGDLQADGSVPLTSDWNVGRFNVTLSWIAGSDPANNTAGLDSRKLGFQSRLWSGSAAVTRTGWIRFEDVSGEDDQGRFTFSSDDNGGSEADFLYIKHDTNTLIHAAAGKALIFGSAAGAPAFQVNSGGGLLFSKTATLTDDQGWELGAGADFRWEYETANQTNNTLLFGTQGSEGNTVVFTDKARLTLDHAVGTPATPTWRWHDGSAVVGNWGSVTHDGTDLLFISNAGDIKLAPAGDIVLDPVSNIVSLGGLTNTISLASGTVGLKEVFTNILQPNDDQDLLIKRRDGATVITARAGDLFFGVTVEIARISGSDPINNTTGLDSRKLGWESRLWAGSAVTRTGWLRTEDVSGTDDQLQFVFSTDDNGGSENDILVIRRASGGATRLSNPTSTDIVVDDNFAVVGSFLMGDDLQTQVGAGADFIWEYETANQTNNTLLFGTQGAEGNTVVFTDKARLTSDHAVGTPGTPTWRYQDGSATLTNWGSVTHDGTDLLWTINAGAFRVTGGGIQGLVTVEANTAGVGSPNILTAAESRKVFTNEGIAEKNFHTLPAAAADIEYRFIVQDVDGMRIVAGTGDTIRLAAVVSIAAGFVESTTIGDVLRLVAINATEWIAVEIIGAGWAVETS